MPLPAEVRFCGACGAPVRATPAGSKTIGRGRFVNGKLLAALLAAGVALLVFSQRERLGGRFKPDEKSAVTWIEKQPWIEELKKTMPPGVTISLYAEPEDAEGWSQVSLRSTHSPGSGFDPNVSPMIGLFRVSSSDRRIEWLEPVSGDFVPVEKFLEDRGLSSRPFLGTTPSAAGIPGGDFESFGPSGSNGANVVIVPDPTQQGNHAARIVGPEEMSFELPLKLSPGIQAVTIGLRLLHPMSTKLLPFEDGSMPEGIRLRVRLVNETGNSEIRDAVVRPTGQWREMEFTFYDPPRKTAKLNVEAIWMEGPVYIDDVKLVPDKP